MKAQDQKQAFTDLIDQNKGIIYKVVNAYCKHKEDRQDLIQEILIQIWRSFEKYNAAFKLSTWMYRISLNVAISFYRKESRRKDTVQMDNADILSISDDTEENEDENVKRLYAFIGELNKVNKAIMILYLEDESYQSIADTLGISETNVATKISRIKKTLQSKFSLEEK